MRFELTQDFPVGLDRLWAALGRRGFVARKYRALGSTSIRILTMHADATSIEVDLEREAPVIRDVLPVWARPFVGARQTMRHHTRWRRVAPDRIVAELDIEALGAKVGAIARGAVVELSPAQSRMRLTVDVTSTSGAPGFAAERVFALQLRHAFRADHAFTLDELRAGAGRK